MSKKPVPVKMKKTKFGLVPNDWRVASLSDLIEGNYILEHIDGNHGSLYPKKHEFVEEGVPYIGANSIIENKINFDNVRFLTEERSDEMQKGIAVPNDVLFAHNATVGPVALLGNEYEKVILSTTLTLYRTNNEIIRSIYLLHYMQSSYYKKQYEKVMKQSTRNQIPITMQRNFDFILPPKQEQDKISAILSAWDKAIELKQQLIDLKREQKKGLMQKLLTGEVRLPGFNEEWKVMKLEKLCSKMKSGGTPKSTNPKFYGGEIPLVKVNDITRQGKILKDAETTITEQGLINSSAWLVPANSILYSMYASIGFVSINKMPVTTNQAIMSMIPNDDVNIDFLYYQLVKYKTKVNSIIETGTQGNLNAKLVKSFSIHLPQYEEQLAIATILNAAESHIELLENELDALKEQKKGLMQQLLTGKTRVKV